MKKILIGLCMILSMSLKSYSQTVYYNQLTDDVSVGLGVYDDTSKVYFSSGSYSMNDEFNDFSFRLVSSSGYEKFNITRFGTPSVNHISATDYGYIFNECIYVMDKRIISYICSVIAETDMLYINGYTCNAMDFLYILSQLNNDYINPHINLIIRTDFFINRPVLPVYSPFHRNQIRIMAPPRFVPMRPVPPRNGRIGIFRRNRDGGTPRQPRVRPNTTNRPAGNPSRGGRSNPGSNPGRSEGARR